MTGGMLGLAGSTGVAEAASDGGSRKIQAAQLPDHTHTFKWKWNTGNATSGSKNWAICLEGTTESAITDYTKLWYTGGGAGLYSCTHLCLWLEKNRLAKLVNANGIR